jgi:hypothetical protein
MRAARAHELTLYIASRPACNDIELGQKDRARIGRPEEKP